MPGPLVILADLPTGLNPIALLDDNFAYLLQLIEAGGGGAGTVTSVGLVAPAEFGVSGSPVTGAGTLALAWAAPVQVQHGGTGTSGAPRIITANGTTTVDAGDGVIIFNQPSAGNSELVLPPVASRAGVTLVIADWAGNAGTVTLTPDGSELVMGLPSGTLYSGGQGLGLGAAIRLVPSVELNGWYAG